MDANVPSQILQVAQTDFERARRKAFFNELGNIFNRKPNWLVSFEDVQKALPITEQLNRGVQQVPVADIIGSVGRYNDFDRAFLPTQSHTRPRWESVDIAHLTDVILPPIQLYKVGDAYFVKDGNHRVSVAKGKGVDFIDAEVIECPISVPLKSISDPKDLLRLAEYARFLEQTHLDRLRPGARIEFTSLGSYDVLLEHVSAHRWFMGIDQKRPVDWEEAVLDWYDNLYLPLVTTIGQTGILDDFPGHTEADLYLWIMNHRWYIREDTGEDMGPTTAVLSYDAQYGRWTRKVVRLLDRMQKATLRPFLISGRRIVRAINASSPILPHIEEDHGQSTQPTPDGATPLAGDR